MKKNQHIPSGYKPSPLGIIPEDWEVKRLGDLCKNKGDYGLNAPATDYSVNLPTYLRITDIDDNGNFIHSAKKSVDNLSAKEYYLKDGDIVFARTGATVGKTYLYDVRDGQLVYAGFLIKFSPNPNKLIPYYLKAHTETKDYTNWVAITSQRSGQPGINAAEYCSLKLAIPPIEEQERICNVLQLWDTTIAKQTALIEQLTLRKRGLMQQLLTGKKRLKGFSGEWKEVRLGEVFDERNETNCDNLPLLSITGDKGVIYQSESDKRDISNEDKSKYKRICPNDIGYNTMRMWQGRSALSELEGIVSPAYTIVTPKDNIDVRFMAMLIQQPRIVYSFWTHSQGLVSDTLNCKYPDFSQVKVSIPSKEEQTAIANFFVGLDKEIELANKKLAATQEQKRGLMQVLLSGEKRIK
jgi:type I restriction enzyme S subunit